MCMSVVCVCIIAEWEARQIIVQDLNLGFVCNTWHMCMINAGYYECSNTIRQRMISRGSNNDKLTDFIHPYVSQPLAALVSRLANL